jgi:hypothetical protein
MNETVDSTGVNNDLTQRIGTRIIDLVKKEFEKKENKQKIDCVKDYVLLYILKAINPYIITVILIMLMILCLQGYLVTKIIYIHSELLSIKL